MEVLLWWLISRSKKPTQNLKKFLEIWNLSQITLQTCVLILVEEFLGFCPCWWEVMKKFKDLSRKSHLEALNPYQILNFSLQTLLTVFFQAESNIKLEFHRKPSHFFLSVWPIRWRSHIWRWRTMISWKAEHGAQTQTGRNLR